MKLFLHGDPTDCRAVRDWCSEHGAFEFEENHHGHQFAQAMLCAEPDAAIAMSNGAAGMEAAIIIRRLYPTLPLI